MSALSRAQRSTRRRAAGCCTSCGSDVRGLGYSTCLRCRDAQKERRSREALATVMTKSQAGRLGAAKRTAGLTQASEAARVSEPRCQERMISGGPCGLLLPCHGPHHLTAHTAQQRRGVEW